jgi:hypothetical protein
MAEKVKVDPKHFNIDPHGKIEITSKALADKMKQLLDERANPSRSFPRICFWKSISAADSTSGHLRRRRSKPDP